MPDLAKISEQTVRAHAGERSFKKGVSYYRSGAVFDTRRRGATLKGRCEGRSTSDTYALSATLSGRRIATADCSCPVGDGGQCKHVVALLLTWNSEPEAFREVADPDAVLQKRSKADLIALIKRMIESEPHLDVLLELPDFTGGAGGRRGKAQRIESAAFYQRQAAAMLRSAGYDRGFGGLRHDGLSTLLESGDRLLKQRVYTGAAAVYQGLSGAIIAEYDSIGDDEGEIVSMVQASVEGLGRCLPHLQGEARTRALQALFSCYRFDVDYGGIGAGDGVPDILTKEGSEDEKRLVATWVREALKGSDRDWGQRHYGGFLLGLEAAQLDDEGYLRVCRETGRTGDAVERLLVLSRAAEAAKLARQAGDYDLLQMTPIFVQHRQGALAEELIRERLPKSQDQRLAEWLKGRYIAAKNLGAALEMAVHVFRLRPGLTSYKDACGLAKKVKWWDDLRPKLLGLLPRGSDGLRIEIALFEKDIAWALDAVRELRQVSAAFSFGWAGDIRLKVATAAEKEFPQEAMEIYRQVAESCIGQRSRHSYQEACRYLKQVRKLMERLPGKASWPTYIQELRARHRSLPALQQELSAAGM